VQGLHGLLDRGVRIEAVNLIEVDVVDVQPPQGCIDLFHDCLAGQPGPARSVMHLAEELGGENDVLAVRVPREGASDDLLGSSEAINVGRVPEGDAELDGLAEDRFGRIVAEGPIEPFRWIAEAHAAQRDAADPEP